MATKKEVNDAIDAALRRKIEEVRRDDEANRQAFEDARERAKESVAQLISEAAKKIVGANGKVTKNRCGVYMERPKKGCSCPSHFIELDESKFPEVVKARVAHKESDKKVDAQVLKLRNAARKLREDIIFSKDSKIDGALLGRIEAFCREQL